MKINCKRKSLQFLSHLSATLLINRASIHAQFIDFNAAAGSPSASLSELLPSDYYHLNNEDYEYYYEDDTSSSSPSNPSEETYNYFNDDDNENDYSRPSSDSYDEFDYIYDPQSEIDAELHFESYNAFGNNYNDMHLDGNYFSDENSSGAAASTTIG